MFYGHKQGDHEAKFLLRFFLVLGMAPPVDFTAGGYQILDTSMLPCSGVGLNGTQEELEGSRSFLHVFEVVGKHEKGRRFFLLFMLRRNK